MAISVSVTFPLDDAVNRTLVVCYVVVVVVAPDETLYSDKLYRYDTEFVRCCGIGFRKAFEEKQKDFTS